MSENVFQKGETARLESVSKESGFDVPVELITLPSKGAIYPPEHPCHNLTSLEIKCMTAKEEDLLTSRALIKNGTVMSQLMRSCLLNKTIDPDDLLVGDRNALLIAIRITGYGANYSAKVGCAACGQEFESEFSLNGLAIKSLSADPVVSNTNLFPFVTPSGVNIQFKLLTGRDEQELNTIADRQKKLGSQVENSVTLRLFHSIVSINGETDRNKIKYAVNNLRARDSLALREHINAISPSVDMHQNVVCKLCGEASEVEVPLGLNFFWPDLGK